MQAVAESWRNLSAVGALPLALTDNLNFGSPERPEIMGQLVGAIEGMAPPPSRSITRSSRAMCRSTTRPAAGPILPTPVIGGVGLIVDAAAAIDLALKSDGDAMILIGDTAGHLGASLYLREIEGSEAGPPPQLTSPQSAATASSCARKSPSVGPPPVTICRMAASSSPLPRWRWPAAAVSPSTRRRAACRVMPGSLARTRGAIWSRPPARPVLAAAHAAAVPARVIGVVGGAALTLSGAGAISVTALKAANEAWLPGYMGQP